MARLKSSLFVMNKRKRLPKREQNGQSSQTGKIAYTRRIKWKQKHNAICVGHHYAQAKTDNGNKTQIIGGKDEPNIVFIRTSQRTSRHGARERLKVSTSYKTPIVLLIYTIQSGKGLGTHRGKKTFTYKVHNLLSFEMWIFHNGQPDCDNDLIIFEAITSTYVQCSLAWVAVVGEVRIVPQISQCNPYERGYPQEYPIEDTLWRHHIQCCIKRVIN
jgi:hypothetical protein